MEKNSGVGKALHKDAQATSAVKNMPWKIKGNKTKTGGRGPGETP